MSPISEPINQLPKPSILEKLIQRHSKLAIALLAIFIVVFVYGMVTAPNFLTLFNFKTIIRDAAWLASWQLVLRSLLYLGISFSYQ